MKRLETADEVKGMYITTPKLLDGWLMVGYRQWFQHKYLRRAKDTKELAANKQLKSLSDSEWKALKNRVKSRLK